jgi:kinesin family protein 3/17
MGSNVSLLDANNRCKFYFYIIFNIFLEVLEEFDAREVYGPEFSLQQIFDTSLTPYLNPFIQGFSVSIFGFGSAGTGKTQTIEGNKKEPGLILLFSDSLFNLLENKKYHTNIGKNAQNFSYGIRIRYVEIIDEEITDLLAGANNYSDPLQVMFHEWEGPTISNATWISVANSTQLNEVFLNGQRSRNNNSNEFGKFSDKATSLFTLELIQTLELADTKENLILISKLNFFDLPGYFYFSFSMPNNSFYIKDLIFYWKTLNP